MNAIFYYLNGGEHPFMTGWECSNHHDWIVWLTISACAAIIIGYLKIAKHWFSGIAKLKPGLAKSSLFTMMLIFVFCAVCGYAFLIFMMWFPYWHVRLFFLIILAICTWRYALNTPKLAFTYEEIHSDTNLVEEHEKQKAITKEITKKVEELTKSVNDLKNKVYFGITDETNPKIINSVNSMREDVRKITEGVKDIKKTTDGG